MEVTATTNLKVDLSNETIKSLSLDYFCAVMNWNPSYHITNEGDLVLTETFYSSHSFTVNHHVRVATPKDIMVAQIFKELQGGSL